MIVKLPLRALHLYVLLALGLFICLQGYKYLFGIHSNWIFHYLNDFLAIPIVATVCLHAVWLLKKDYSVRLNLFTILSLVALFSIFFEYYLPQKSHRYTGDIWDVGCYLLGGMIFFLLQRRE